MFSVLLILLLTNLIIADYCDPNLCPSGRIHIACNHTGTFNVSCPPDRALVNFSDAEVLLILDTHNSLRNKIASGNESGFNSAAKMSKLSWDDELASLAALNVFQCRMQHDRCRTTYQFFRAGQNLAFRASTGTLRDVSFLLNTLIMGWYNEVQNATMSDLKSCCGSNLSKIGHFTQIVQDEAIAIGCAAARYTNGMFRTFLLACNYSYGNVLAKPVYAEGPPASECGGKGISSQYSSLCN